MNIPLDLPQEAYTHIALANQALEDDDIIQAIEMIRAALEYEPDNLWLNNTHGNLLLSNFNFLEAKQVFSFLTELYPNFAEGFLSLSKALAHLDLVGESQTALRRANELSTKPMDNHTHKQRNLPPAEKNTTQNHLKNNYYLKHGYKSNLNNSYFLDNQTHCIHQHDVYSFAEYLTKNDQIDYVIDIGAGNGEKLEAFSNVHIVGVDIGKNLDLFKNQNKLLSIKQIQCDLEEGFPEFSKEILEKSVVICSDVIEHLRDPKVLLANLSHLSREAKYLLISTPDRTRARGIGDNGIPKNLAHVREWTIEEFNELLKNANFGPYQIGFSYNNNYNLNKNIIAVLTGKNLAIRTNDIRQMRILAIIHMFNESDIISETINHLLSNDIDVLVLDNWSTDKSYNLVNETYKSNPSVRIRRFPSEASDMYRWHNQLLETEKIAAEENYDWFLHYDADEIRESPWLGYSLNQAISFVDHLGYSAINFTVLNFEVTPNIMEDLPVFQRLVRARFGSKPGHFIQIKCWKKSEDIKLADFAGHDVSFEGKRVFPIKFLLRHYYLRSFAHAKTKIFRDRKPRFQEEKEKFQWHTQYDNIKNPSDFIRQTNDTIPFDRRFYDEFLIERLSGIGVDLEE